METIEKDKIIEKEIQEQQRNISYDTKEYTVEIIVKKYQVIKSIKSFIMSRHK